MRQSNIMFLVLVRNERNIIFSMSTEILYFLSTYFVFHCKMFYWHIYDRVYKHEKQVLIKSKKVSSIFKYLPIIVLHFFLLATVFLYVSMQLFLSFLFLFFFLSMTTRLALQITFMRIPALQVRSDLTI